MSSTEDGRPSEADPLRLWFRFVRLHRRVASAVAAELRAVGLSIPQFATFSRP